MNGKTNTNDINRVTKSIITVSWKLIVFALAILLLYEVVARGYEFGYSLFYDTAVDEPPGMDMAVTIGEDETLGSLAVAMEKGGLVKNRFSFMIQCIFYEYGYEFLSYGNPVKAGTYLLNTSMSAKEIIITLRDGDGTETTEENGAEE